MPAAISFHAVLEPGGPSFMPTQVVAVPEAVCTALGRSTKRVVCTIGRRSGRLGLLPATGSGRYLLLRKDLCQQLGLAIGQGLTLVLLPDPEPDRVTVPAELAESLAAWPEAEATYQPLNSSMKRAMARHVADAKTAETRARRAVQLAERLARGGPPVSGWGMNRTRRANTFTLMSLPYHRLIVKIGSNVLTQPNGLPDLNRLAALVAQVAVLHAQGLEVIVVSSGAVAAGRSLLTLPPKTDAVRSRQVLAAVGQVKLLGLYAELLAGHGLLGAQVLVTKEDFRDRQHYQNMQNCFLELLQQQVVPIVNENDVVAVTELMFTDNDELAGLIAAQLSADALIILTNVDGIFDGDPQAPGAQVIREITPGATGFAGFVTAQRSQFGRGGMLTKCHMAHKVAKLGIGVHIANGRTDDILPAVLAGTAVNTWFRPGKTASGKKKWLAHATAQAVVRVNAGARAALTAPGHASSLLPVGVVAIEGTFQKGDIVQLIDDASGHAFALGIAEYGADRALEGLGQQHKRALVHYDYLFLNPDA